MDHDAPNSGETREPRKFQIVVAATRKGRGIGINGQLPWRLPSDMRFFKQVTTDTEDPTKRNAVIMGRRTWDSLPSKFKPLPGRLNVVLSRQIDLNLPPDVIRCDSLEAALQVLTGEEHGPAVERVFVIGGGQVYREALKTELCEAIHLTEIEGDFTCDAFLPEISAGRFRTWKASAPTRENGIRYSFITLLGTGVYTGGTKIDSLNHNQTEAQTADDAASAGRPSDASETKCLPNGQLQNGSVATGNSGTAATVLPREIQRLHEEYQYLDLIEDIIASGNLKPDRTGTGTLSKFGCQMRFNLRHSFPLLTTKRVFWRGVVEELLWFVSGSTSAKVLQDKGIRIWDGNGSREYLDSIGLRDREEGDLGPVYGFQWRHFGAKYQGMHADYSGQGVDQLADVIHRIKTNPNDRRIMLSAWNPSDLGLMALPPCHVMAQFYVSDGELSCQLYQRSCDMGLGVPFNIASYSLLTCMIAHVCGLNPGDFVHVLGDAHVYSNHIEPLKQQLQNKPRPFPTLHIRGQVDDIDGFSTSDFELQGYAPHNKISMVMAV